jgi:hypothetical protein
MLAVVSPQASAIRQRQPRRLHAFPIHRAGHFLPHSSATSSGNLRGTCRSTSKERVMISKTAQGVQTLGQLMQRAGPYLLIELALPGGTLIALTLLLYRRGPARLGADLSRIGEAVLEGMRAAKARAVRGFRARFETGRPTLSRRERDGLEPLGFALD